MSIQDEMREVQKQLDNARFQRGFLRGLLAAVGAINAGGNIEEIKDRIRNIPVPEEMP